MIIKRILGLIPTKYKSYEYVSQYIPRKYKGGVDKLVQQFAPKLASTNSSTVNAEFSNSSSDEASAVNNEGIEKKRKNLIKNMSNDEGQFPKGFTDNSKEQSLKDHGPEGAFSSSSVNGAGGNSGGKINSNMAHRNYTH